MNVPTRKAEFAPLNSVSPLQALDDVWRSVAVFQDRFQKAVEEMHSQVFDPFVIHRFWTKFILMNCTLTEDVRTITNKTWLCNPFDEIIHWTSNWLKWMSEASILMFDNPLNHYNLQKAAQEIMLTQLWLAAEISHYLKNKLWENTVSNFIDAEVQSTEVFLAHREKPKWNLDVEPEIVHSQDFCHILKFENPELPKDAPKIFLVAPMSWHYATLLRGTVRELMKTNHVYITDWKDARQVPKDIEFWTDDYTAHLIDAFQVLWKQDVNSVVAVCQPCPWVLTAAAYCEKNWLYRPENITLMSWPIDISKNPTEVNKHAHNQTIEDLANKVISTVPTSTNWEQNVWVWREVYPGWMQLMSFMWMNIDRHLWQLRNLREAFLQWNHDSVQKEIIFYDEYMAVMDLTKKFFLETVERIFIKNEAASGIVKFWGSKKYWFQADEVDFSDYTGRLMTMEAELDDVCGKDQTKAALEICKSASEKVFYMLRLAGHYWVFDGTMFRLFVAPRINLFIRWGDVNSYIDTPEAIAYLEKKIVKNTKSTN